ncbi:surfeit locus protein 6 [Thalassophryne amazonica]|uniref:surfeit locus protein 6 n=1 Tax=Thalassophryne amazonica TaxID=390379 RepID=UPI0014724E61|nr:surfeit locus protein 6 [Thalassophryne amazonica]
MDLASKDAYIQKLASKVISQRNEEHRKRPFAHVKCKNDTGPAKKRKKKKNKEKQHKQNATDKKTPKLKPQQKSSNSPAVQNGPAKPSGPKTSGPSGAASEETQKSKGGNIKSNFSTVDILRKRLHEKIEASRGQGSPKDASSEAVQAKRAKRKLERERKKRKRKEFRIKKLAEESGQEPKQEIKQENDPPPAASKRDSIAMVFNKVETVEEAFVDKMLIKKNKKKNIKGKLTPLTGKNYKQLLNRVEARKAKLEELRQKDEGKARQFEEKMKWTNLLYKAEGLKIKDNEDMLRASLKKKEKQRTQRKKQWEKRSEHIIEKMQQRQDKRRKNIQKRKNIKMEKKKERARKKGRVLPEDLKKASV